MCVFLKKRNKNDLSSYETGFYTVKSIVIADDVTLKVEFNRTGIFPVHC